MKILDEMFARFHHPFSFFPFPEETSMSFHGIENLSECRFIVSWEEAPGVTERCPSDHEAIEIFIENFIFELRIEILIYLI